MFANVKVSQYGYRMVIASIAIYHRRPSNKRSVSMPNVDQSKGLDTDLTEDLRARSGYRVTSEKIFRIRCSRMDVSVQLTRNRSWPKSKTRDTIRVEQKGVSQHHHQQHLLLTRPISIKPLHHRRDLQVQDHRRKRQRVSITIDGRRSKNENRK